MVVVHAIWSADNRLALWGDGGEPAEVLVELLAGSTVDGLAHKATAGQLELLLPRGETLACTEIPVALFDVDAALGVLDAVRGQLYLEYEDGGGTELAPLGDSVRFLAELAAIAADFVERRRVLPAVVGDEARWVPVPAGADRDRLRALAAAAPPVLRAEGRGRTEVLIDALTALTDGATRIALESLTLLPGRRGGQSGATEAWLAALTGPDARIDAPEPALAELRAALDAWHRSAAEASDEVRVCFRLEPPEDDEDDEWGLEFLVQDVAEPSLIVGTAEIWRSDAAMILFDRHVERPQEALLAELGRASRLWPELDDALRSAMPTGLVMDTVQAYWFLRAAAPLLAQAGFGVLLPSTWRPGGIGLKLSGSSPGTPGTVQTRSQVGFDALVDYRWQVALGEHVLTGDELDQLARAKAPLVRMRGQWVEVDHIRLRKALAYVDRQSGGRMSVAELLRIGSGVQELDVDLPVVGVEASGWVGDLLSGQLDHRLRPVPSPDGLAATLRPYQERGLSWLAFLDDLRLGGVLADDMGLGKTVQTLALLLRERGGGPTLLVCPMSVVGNWQREAARFAPELSVHVHHGSDRLRDDGLLDAAAGADLVITTYAVATRDAGLLGRIDWRRVVLDEAQHIKNSATKQSAAVRGLPAQQRIALTGTPVENRLAELWSIVDFVNPGLLGSLSAFRERFAVPIERHGDERAAARLKKITGPFVLRRLKTDPAIISDLPDKIEMKVLCNLTAEQASLYQAVVDDMLAKIESSEGIERKGLVLATMTKLKQVCNHPAHLLRDGTRLTGRSGKLARLEEILEEVLAEGDRALCFTQFTEFGELLHRHLANRFGQDVLYLHGGTPKRRRDAMVAAFQSGDGPPIFLLSLKAGGTGLNLTAANHVIHFDRWWNPAVEDQATDRAFRIGQRKNVQVRKFVCVGTLEEKIDTMIESKKALSRMTVGSGESWLTELSVDELREVVTLSADAVSE
ncbi:MAG TPA: DEAD/DEAH box helicase [Actinophytocola sp.]|uniref:DEAD/DEAH box helicase n=1 Tax=Actinophytocola sp. TaxID=1872138 RepID=UPI002DDCA054|nr:DEAD/DEAH box helicase [Actinophytocola sp.]HEV2783157.1 DEAD/DEAH box helicase [Actinophytocola sp.]